MTLMIRFKMSRPDSARRSEYPWAERPHKYPCTESGPHPVSLPAGAEENFKRGYRRQGVKPPLNVEFEKALQGAFTSLHIFIA